MLKDITLGQFFPGDSFIHRLDPRTKLVMVVIYIVALFMAKGWLAYGFVIAFLALCIKISGIPVKSITRGMKPVLVVVILTGLLNTFLVGLAADDRILFLRRYWYGDDLKTLATQMGITRNNTAVRLSRLRGKLKAFLEQEGYTL